MLLLLEGLSGVCMKLLGKWLSIRCPNFISEKDVGFLPDDKVVIICTGSQGEPRAALSRMADDSHMKKAAGGDVVIFSSRQI